MTGPAKQLRGVKPKEKLRRTGHLTIRLSAEERAAIDSASERAGLMTGSWSRQVLLGAPTPRQVRRPIAEKAILVRILGELGKIGGNLNQLARASNSGVIVFEGEIESELAGLRAARDAILAALGREP